MAYTPTPIPKNFIQNLLGQKDRNRLLAPRFLGEMTVQESGNKRTTLTLWLFNIAMENGPFIDDFPIKTSIYKGFSMAMLDIQKVIA